MRARATRLRYLVTGGPLLFIKAVSMADAKSKEDDAKITVTVLTFSGETVATLSIVSSLPVLSLKQQLGDPVLIALHWEGKVLQDSETPSSLAWPSEVTLTKVEMTFDHERPITLLRDQSNTFGVMDGDEARRMCTAMKELLLKEANVLELQAPLVISAHLTGNLNALNYIFNTFGEPGGTSHLFLGNYVNKGRNGIDVMILLLCFKKKFPGQVHLLRGKHECSSIARIYGFYDECKHRFPSRSGVKLFRQFVEVFDNLPLAAVIQSRVFCVSSGLSPKLDDLEELRKLQRPLEVGSDGLVCDLLWSDPEDHQPGWHEMDKGMSYTYGPDVVDEFLKKNHMDFIVRGTQVVEEGYEFFADGKGVSIFSFPSFLGEFNNKASVMLLDEQLQQSLHTFDDTMLPVPSA